MEVAELLDRTMLVMEGAPDEASASMGRLLGWMLGLQKGETIALLAATMTKGRTPPGVEDQSMHSKLSLLAFGVALGLTAGAERMVDE